VRWCWNRSGARALSQKTVEVVGQKIQVSLISFWKAERQIGALSHHAGHGVRRQIEDEIELSRRLAAIGRLTSELLHEVKNPS